MQITVEAALRANWAEGAIDYLLEGQRNMTIAQRVLARDEPLLIYIIDFHDRSEAGKGCKWMPLHIPAMEKMTRDELGCLVKKLAVAWEAARRATS